jgi:hypothetical protein
VVQPNPLNVGFISIQRFYIYAEPGLSRQRVAIWIYEGQLHIEYRETLIARYRGRTSSRVTSRHLTTSQH